MSTLGKEGAAVLRLDLKVGKSGCLSEGERERACSRKNGQSGQKMIESK